MTLSTKMSADALLAGSPASQNNRSAGKADLNPGASVLTPDICIIGGGSGGLSVAAACASLGVSVVLVEKHKMGGDCLNSGCVPSKALIASAKRAHQVRTSSVFGIAGSEPHIDFAKVQAHVQSVIASISPNDGPSRFRALGVNVIQATGRFIDQRTLEAGDVRVRARRFVIAAGSSPLIPAIPGLQKVPYLTNESVFNLDAPVGHLLIIGGGAIGLEFAQAYRRLGSRVTVFESTTALAKDDPELVHVALRALKAEGITLHENVAVTGVSGRSGAIEVSFAGGTVSGSHLLVAAGRKPNTDGLGLDLAGVTISGTGVVVDNGLRTSNRRIFAIGDVVGGAQFTHIANHHAGIVIQRALFRYPARVAADRFPRVTFTDPEIAQVGLTEREARDRRYSVIIYRSPFGDNDRASTDRVESGLVKVICDRRGKILGAGIVGANAGELIAIWSLALSQGLNIKAMTQWIAPYPTLAEVSKRAAFGALANEARRPIVRRLLSFLRKLG